MSENGSRGLRLLYGKSVLATVGLKSQTNAYKKQAKNGEEGKKLKIGSF
jgi:hypothetical protein